MKTLWRGFPKLWKGINVRMYFFHLVCRWRQGLPMLSTLSILRRNDWLVQHLSNHFCCSIADSQREIKNQTFFGQDYEHLPIEYDDEPVIVSVNLVDGHHDEIMEIKGELDLDGPPHAVSKEVPDLLWCCNSFDTCNPSVFTPWYLYMPFRLFCLAAEVDVSTNPAGEAFPVRDLELLQVTWLFSLVDAIWLVSPRPSVVSPCMRMRAGAMRYISMLSENVAWLVWRWH